MGAELLLVLEDVRRIASVGAHSRTDRDATIARSAAHNPSTSRIENEVSILAVYKRRFTGTERYQMAQMAKIKVL